MRGSGAWPDWADSETNPGECAGSTTQEIDLKIASLASFLGEMGEWRCDAAVTRDRHQAFLLRHENPEMGSRLVLGQQKKPPARLLGPGGVWRRLPATSPKATYLAFTARWARRVS